MKYYTKIFMFYMGLGGLICILLGLTLRPLGSHFKILLFA